MCGVRFYINRKFVGLGWVRAFPFQEPRRRVINLVSVSNIARCLEINLHRLCFPVMRVGTYLPDRALVFSLSVLDVLLSGNVGALLSHPGRFESQFLVFTQGLLGDFRRVFALNIERVVNCDPPWELANHLLIATGLLIAHPQVVRLREVHSIASGVPLIAKDLRTAHIGIKVLADPVATLCDFVQCRNRLVIASLLCLDFQQGDRLWVTSNNLLWVPLL